MLPLKEQGRYLGADVEGLTGHTGTSICIKKLTFEGRR